MTTPVSPCLTNGLMLLFMRLTLKQGLMTDFTYSSYLSSSLKSDLVFLSEVFSQSLFEHTLVHFWQPVHLLIELCQLFYYVLFDFLSGPQCDTNMCNKTKVSLNLSTPCFHSVHQTLSSQRDPSLHRSATLSVSIVCVNNL